MYPTAPPRANTIPEKAGSPKTSPVSDNNAPKTEAISANPNPKERAVRRPLEYSFFTVNDVMTKNMGRQHGVIAITNPATNAKSIPTLDDGLSTAYTKPPAERIRRLRVKDTTRPFAAFSSII